MPGYLTKTLSMIALAGLVLLPSAAATGDVLLVDRFDYPDGDLNGRDGGFELNGATWTGAWSGPTESISELGTVPAPIFQVNNGVVLSGNPGTAQSYWSMDRPMSLGLPTNTATYFSIVLNQVGNEGGYQFFLDFDSGVRVGMHDDWWRAQLGSAAQLSATKEIPVAAQDFRVVGLLEFDAVGADERLTMWIDPASESDAPKFVLEQDLGVTGLGSLASLVQHSGVDNNKAWDSLIVATDFDSVNAEFVPEPGTIVLLLTGAAFVLLAGRYRRRK